MLTKPAGVFLQFIGLVLIFVATGSFMLMKPVAGLITLGIAIFCVYAGGRPARRVTGQVPEE